MVTAVELEKSESRLRNEFEKGDRALHARMNDAIGEMRKSRKTMDSAIVEIAVLAAKDKDRPDETGIRNMVNVEAGKVVKAHFDLCNAKNAGDKERFVGKAVLGLGAKIGGVGLGAGVGFAGIQKLIDMWIG